ncbi:MAG TPA: hypothetical protein VMZ31_15120 [Phycisphaerae bacterium]|nr:hypothetical protein [Phycisphaerae bacterium]
MNRAEPTESEQAEQSLLESDLTALGSGQQAPSVSLAMITARLLQVLAIVVALIGFGGPLAGLAVIATPGQSVPPKAILLAVAAIVVALSYAAALFALGVLVQVGDATRELADRIEQWQRGATVMSPAQAVPSAPPPPSAESSAPATAMLRQQAARMLNLLEAIQEASLLTEQQRRTRWERLAAQRCQALRRQIDDLLLEGRFVQARQFADELETRWERPEEASTLRERIRTARDESQAADLADARRRIGEFMSVSRWDRAEQVVEELVLKYQDSTELAELRDRVKRERVLAEAEYRRQLQRHIEQAVAGRQWSQATASAEQFLAKYGDSDAARLIREKLPTLRANAEIETRQHAERDIKELIRRHRYGEALERARELIEKYPTSPQAEALRGQIPRLEQRAREQAPP